MKLQSLHCLIVPDRGGDLRAFHSIVARTLSYASASNDALFQRPRLTCRWQRNPATGRREARWTTSS